jgi:hypothetical protein
MKKAETASAAAVKDQLRMPPMIGRRRRDADHSVSQA